MRSLAVEAVSLRQADPARPHPRQRIRPPCVAGERRPAVIERHHRQRVARLETEPLDEVFRQTDRETFTPPATCIAATQFRSSR